MSSLEKYRVKVFGASVDPVELNQKFAQQNQYSFPLLSDPTKEVAKAYGVLSPMGLARRWTFVIDENGTIKKIDTMVKPGSHGKDVAAALEELGVPKR